MQGVIISVGLENSQNEVNGGFVGISGGWEIGLKWY